MNIIIFISFKKWSSKYNDSSIGHKYQKNEQFEIGMAEKTEDVKMYVKIKALQ